MDYCSKNSQTCTAEKKRIKSIKLSMVSILSETETIKSCGSKRIHLNERRVCCL